MPYKFSLSNRSDLRIGEMVSFLGFPLEHRNLTCHSGVISALYSDGIADIIQIDGSVNPSNSGGPLIDIGSGDVIGIVTRKATGLTRAFDALRNSLISNIKIIKSTGGGLSVGGLDIMQALEAQQNQMLTTLSEIERQAT